VAAETRDPVMTGVVERNITELMRRRAEEAQRATKEERIADAITGFAGSMRFVYIHVAVYGTWLLWNLRPLGLPRFDPTYVVLAMVASVEAIFISTFVLISQNRMSRRDDDRADLDLQICLLTEHEVTRLVTLVAAIARRQGIAEAHDPEIAELEQDVRPARVMEVLDEHRDEVEQI
jgi:uncharacterized membrane protein